MYEKNLSKKKKGEKTEKEKCLDEVFAEEIGFADSMIKHNWKK